MKFSYVVFVKSSDKLLNHLMFGQTLIEVKMEMLKVERWLVGSPVPQHRDCSTWLQQVTWAESPGCADTVSCHIHGDILTWRPFQDINIWKWFYSYIIWGRDTVNNCIRWLICKITFRVFFTSHTFHRSVFWVSLKLYNLQSQNMVEQHYTIWFHGVGY